MNSHWAMNMSRAKKNIVKGKTRHQLEVSMEVAGLVILLHHKVQTSTTRQNTKILQPCTKLILE